MAVKGKGKQVAGKAPASSASFSGKRKSTRAHGESSGALPKKKCSGVSQFVDDVAADADFEGGEEEEEEDDFEWEMDEDFDFELPDIGAKEVKNGTKGPGKSSPLPSFIKEEELNDDELEEAIKERYRGSGFVSFDEDVKECDESLYVAHATKDLSFWRVKCMMGRERQTAFCLMQKFVDLLKIGKQLQIFSVFALDHVKGFVYVEADKACNVFEACNGLCFMYPSRIELVPRNEAPNLLSIQKKACGISKGMWVRMKNGKYKGDLAEAVLVNDAKKRVTIKLVPRIDLQAIAKKFGGGTSLKAAAIPAPRLISSHELEDFRPHIEVRRDRETGEIFEVLDGLMLKDGYLYKKVSMGSLIHWGVQPSSDELTKFEDLCMDEVKDVSWLSSIYKTKMKKRLPETSHQRNGEKSNLKNGEKSNQKDGEKSNHQKDGEKSNHKDGEKSSQMDGDKQSNDFDIDDFVLFGKKDCGIIIDKENDTFKVLKGDVIGSEVVTINIRVIKKNCVDKVFTATDRCKKTISIDDVVKVFEGPSEGREGIVRHMYKGVLFIYDECQSENNGFFCAKSEICDLVKKSRDFGGGKLGSNVGPSFAQSPIRSSKEDDNSQSFSRNGQSNSRGTFSVGQTLRICKGPLKGYLCRVIRIYRADVTVKLDSLGKLLTVDEKLLSFSNSKRDDATAMQCDIFGSEEGQSAGGGLGMDNFEFNAGMSSFGRDSWNTPSCSNFSFSRDNDNKDQNQVADPWGSKLSSWNGDQDQGAANSWGKAPSSSAEQSSWNKMVNEEKGSDANCKNDADSWNKASTKGETSTGGTPNSWGKAPSSSAEQSSWNKKVNEEKGSDANCKNDADAWNKASTKGETSTGGTPFQKTDLTWSTKGATSGWDSAVTVVDSDAGGWNKARLSTTDSESVEGQALGEDGWNRTKSKPHTVSSTETSGWERTKLPSSDGCGNWNTQGADADGNKETSGKDRAEGFGGQMGNWVSPKSGGGDNLDSWGIKGKGLLGINDDSWSKSAASKETKPVDKNPWQSSFNSSVQSKAWKTTSVDEKTAPSHIGCEKSEAGSTETGGWKKSTDGNQAAGWAATAMHSGTSSFEDGSQSNSWSKVKSLPSSGGWEKPKATVTETVGGWKATTDSNQAAGWGTAMPSATPSIEHESQTSSWDKVSISPSSSQWQISKPADATAKEGWKKDGFSGEGQIDRWNKEKSSNRDQASGWNKAGNGEGGKDAWTDSWDKAKSSEGSGFGQESRGQWKSGGDWRNNHHDPNLGKSNDSDTGQGLGWSEGQSNNESGKSWGYGNSCSWNQQRDFDGGRGSGRGSGRGRYGGRGGRNKDNFENPDGSDGGWRFGRGGGRGRNGAGGYNRDNSDTREFGRGRGRGRGRGERFGSYSNKPPSSWGSTEVSDWGKSRDQHSAGASWNSGNSYDRGNKPSWGTDPQDAGGSKNEMNEDHDSGWSKGVNTGKQIDNCSKETRKNDNWNTPKTFDNKLSSWNQTSNDTAKDTTSIQSTDWVHGLSETKVTTNDDKWTKAKSSSGDHGDTFSGKSNSNDWCKTATPNEENEAADSQGGWSSKKAGQASQPSSETVNNWGKLKETCSGNTAGNLGSSEGWTENSSANWDSRSNGWDSKKELTSGQSNWGGEDSAGNRPSDWSNGGGNKSSKQSGSRGNSQSWSHGSDSGRGGGRRDNSFSRGRGFGRNSGGRHSCSWNSSDDSAKEDNEESKTGGSWSKGHGTSEGGKSSWNSGGNAEKGSWGSWKSEGTDQSADQAKQRCGWTASASASVNTVEGSSVDGSWNLVNSEGWTDNDWVNCDSRSRSCDSKKVPTSIQGNWGSKDSSGDQSSDWENGDGNKWNKQLGSQDKSESWSQRSDFGRGGGIGRGNSFSGRGRGLGRNSGGRHSSSWNSSDDYGIKGDDRGQAFNLNQEFRTGGPWSKGHGTSEGERGSWTSGGNAEKGSWGSSKSEGEIQPANQAKQGGSGWTASAFSADGSTNWNSGSSSLDTKEEPIANQPSWGGNDYSVRQSSGWENGDGNKWNKQTGSQDRLESWSRQSDFGRGGGRGRHSSFSGRGRSLGRNSGGRGYGKEGNDGWQASNSNQEFKTGGSWNSGGNAERSSRGGWKLEGEDQPAGRANPGSESEGGKGSWDQAESPKWQ